jgi:hypothetical protein
MYYSYTGGRRKNMSFHLDKKRSFTPTLGVNTKNIPYRISPNKCSNILVTVSQKFYCRKETCGYTKVIHKKEKKVLEKMEKCPRYLKQWVLRCPFEKRDK